MQTTASTDAFLLTIGSGKPADENMASVLQMIVILTVIVASAVHSYYADIIYKN